MTSNHTIVETLVACRSALKDLEIEEFVAVDAEGINLSKTGPLTLLQIGTSGGHVYLFDVATEPRMFHDGGLKQFLENASIVKVIHSSRNDGEALYWQFDVVLQGVFDTQLAQMELDKLEGHLLPSRKKLAEVCAKYSPEKTEILNEDKDALHSKWKKKDGDYWNRRPLTQEMIQYACNDVVVLVPEVYTVQKGLLERQGLLKKFQKHVQQDIESRRNKELQDKLHREQDAAVLRVLRDFARNVTSETKLEGVTDENVLAAFNQLRISDDTLQQLPQSVLNLWVQFLRSKLEEIQKELKDKGDDFEPRSYTHSILEAGKSSRDKTLEELANRMQGQIGDIVLKDITKKYTLTTPICHLAGFEKKVLIYHLRMDDLLDPSADAVTSRLYWLAKEEDLDEMAKRYHDDPVRFQVKEGYVRRLKLCVREEVPASLRNKAKGFLNLLKEAGKMPSPKSRGRGQGRGRRGYRH